MKKGIILFSVVFIFTLFSEIIVGVPGRRVPISKQLPDGTTLTIIICGDEKNNWISTIDNYTIRSKSDGFYYYVQLIDDSLQCSNVKASDPQNRLFPEKEFLKQIKKGISKRAGTSLRSSVVVDNPGTAGWLLEDNPYRGKSTLEYIVVPISYPDKPLKSSAADIDSLCNRKNLNKWDLVGSVKDYFEDMSFGKFSAQARVLPVYTTQKGYGSYGKEGTNMDSEIIHYLNSHGITWSELSKHGAPIIAVVFPGFSQSDTGESNDIWANQHKFAKATNTIYIHYANILYTPEFDNYPEELPGTYTFCHEFSHALGVPDLYDTDYEYNGSHFNHLGWDVMVGSVSRNAPPHNSFIRHKLGWMQTAIELNKPTGIQLKSVEKEQCGYYFKGATPGEFFWLENRQPDKWNKDLPNYGMLIYHVDSTTWYNNCSGKYESGPITGWVGRNSVNANALRPGFDLEEADGILSWETRHGDCFPGTANITTFDDNTTPGTKDYAGNVANRPLKNIKKTDEIISFDFMGGGASIAEVYATETKLVSHNEIKVDLKIVTGTDNPATECGIYYGLTPALQTKKVTGKANGSTGEVTITGLLNNMVYYFAPYIITNGTTIKGAVYSQRTSLPQINNRTVTFDFTKSETMNSITPQANPEKYVPYIDNNKRLCIPYSSKIIFPMMSVTAGKEMYIRVSNTGYISPTEFTPYFYYRYGYNEEWKKIDNELSLIDFTPQQDLIQFAMGAENESSYYHGSYVNYTFPPYYQCSAKYTPIVTFYDTWDPNWTVTSFPFVPQYDKEDYSTWGNKPNGSTYGIGSVNEYMEEDYLLLGNDHGFYSSDIILPYINTSKLNNPSLRFYYQGEFGEGIHVDYRIGNSKDWNNIESDYDLVIMPQFSSECKKEYILPLPKNEHLQIRIRNKSHADDYYGVGEGEQGVGNIHHLKISDAETFSISNAGIIDNKPVIKIDLSTRPEYFEEYGIVVNGNRIQKCNNAQYSISYIRVNNLADNEKATIKGYVKTKEGTVIYTPNEITVTQPELPTNIPAKSTFVCHRGKYTVMRSSYYPTNGKIVLQGICWNQSGNPTVEKNDGLLIVEDTQKERLDSIIPQKSGTVYQLRPFYMCEGESVYTYGDPMRFISGASGTTELTLPYNFSNCSISELNENWTQSGYWNVFSDGLYSRFENYHPLKYFTLTTPVIRSNSTASSLKINGSWSDLKIYIIEAVTGNKHEAKLYFKTEKYGLFKLPAVSDKFQIQFEWKNEYTNWDLNISSIELADDNRWISEGEEALPDNLGNYLIDSPQKLAWIASMVNKNQYWSRGKSFRQTCDIDLSNKEWVAIGNSVNQFSGQYDGGNHSIHGLTIQAPNQRYVGLFGYITYAGIKNLHLKSGAVIGGDRVAALSGFAHESSIINCTNDISVQGKGDIGGLLGYGANMIIVGCINQGDILNYTGNNTGGIIGYSFGGNISGCANWGNIEGLSYVGGIYGGGPSSGVATLYGVYNSGKIQGDSYTGAIGGYRIYSTGTNGAYYDKQASSFDGNLKGFNYSDTGSLPKTTESLKSADVVVEMNEMLNICPNFTSIMGQEYGWTVDPAGNYPILTYEKTTSGNCETITDEKITMYCNDNILTIRTQDSGRVYIYSTAGYLLKDIEVGINKTDVELASGIYIIRYKDEVKKISVY